MTYDLATARELVISQARGFLGVAESLDDLELLDPSRCRGWDRLDVVVHVRAGLEEMTSSALVRAPEDADRDWLSYWPGFADHQDDDPVPHLMWLRRTASAYTRPTSAVTHLADVVTTTCRVVEHLPEGRVPFQGHVLDAADFLTTWVVELAIHELDLDLASEPVGLEAVRATVEGLSGATLPAQMDPVTAVLAGLGRAPWPADVDRPSGLPITL